jgi:hypothetical protein
VLIAAALGACGGASTSGLPRDLVREARPIGNGPRFAPPVHGSVAGRCGRPLGPRFGVHVEVFAADRVLLVPAGIGARPPRTSSAGRVSGARCYGSLVTLDPTGLVLVRGGTRARLGDLFRAWGQPLSPSRLASFPGRVAVFVDGRRWHRSAASVPLTEHAEIVVEVGAYVPPHSSYAFPPGL